MPSSTVSNCVLSWRWPAVREIESGLPFPSQERCILVERPPRLLPMASSSGWEPPFSVTDARTLTSPGGVLVRAGHSAIHADGPFKLTSHIRPDLQLREKNLPGAIAAPADKAIVAGLPGTVAFGHVAPGRAGPQSP